MAGNIGPEKALPYSSLFQDADAYVDALLSFVSESEILHTFCGNVHVIDFLIQEPDLFTSILPPEWTAWLVAVPIPDILDLLLREDLASLEDVPNGAYASHQWRGYPHPPTSLLQYVRAVRSLCLARTFTAPAEVPPANLTLELAIGMKHKKAHEVSNFAAFVDNLMSQVNTHTAHQITHVVDFGSGQNYLGRVLACPLYQRRIIAVESQQLNIDAAKIMDINSRVAKKILVLRNKKAFRATGSNMPVQLPGDHELVVQSSTGLDADDGMGTEESMVHGGGRIQYVEHRIADGNLHDVFARLQPGEAVERTHEPYSGDIGGTDEQRALEQTRNPPEVLVVSLHSCGNLLHHGLRSASLNDNVKAVAMVGCCYNLVTERLGPPTMKYPVSRSYNRRVEDCAAACDPHGFPMSNRLANHSYRGDCGVRMNVTARMMAVQAPQNWTESSSESFFTKHFYRALLQKLIVDKGIVKTQAWTRNESIVDNQVEAEALTIGTLPKKCYQSFVTYVRGAIDKIAANPPYAEKAKRLMLELSDEEIESYWSRYAHKKHQLAIIWSLMAFTAGIVESLIVTDRWLYLREQDAISKAWVQTVFEYGLSPRNLVVVGIKA